MLHEQEHMLQFHIKINWCRKCLNRSVLMRQNLTHLTAFLRRAWLQTSRLRSLPVYVPLSSNPLYQARKKLIRKLQNIIV